MSIVEKWLRQGYADSSQRLYGYGLNVFIEFLNQTTKQEWSAEVLAEKRQSDLERREFWFEDKVVEFFEWLKSYEKVKGNPGSVGDNTRIGFVTGVRSFFSFLRCDLHLTLQQRRQLGKRARLVNHDYLFSLEDFGLMDKVANPQERYIAFVGKDIGLRATDFLSLNQGVFVKAIQRSQHEPTPIFLGKIYTRKEGVYAYPFLTDDGLQAARVWLAILKSKQLNDDEAPMLRFRDKELTENLKRLARKADIETHGQRIRFHCLRKFLIDRLSLRMSESKWKQIVGKKISESAYVTPFKLRQEYARVMQHIQIEASQEQRLSMEDVRALKRMLKMMEDGKLTVPRRRI